MTDLNTLYRQIHDIGPVLDTDDIQTLLDLTERMGTEADLALRSRRRALIILYAKARKLDAARHASAEDRYIAVLDLQAAALSLVQAFGTPPPGGTEPR